MIVGGHQYRVGAHRLFVLVARSLADADIPVMRFDYRGMGDSSGDSIGFANIKEDLQEAIRTFLSQTHIEEVVLLGLCDGATAAVIHGTNHPHVAGMILINTWISSRLIRAQAYLRYYYLSRICNFVFWKKLFLGKLKVRKNWVDLLNNIRDARQESTSSKSSEPCNNMTLLEGMGCNMRSFSGNVLFLFSSDDLTAMEFLNQSKKSQTWKLILRKKNVSSVTLKSVDHTFSSAKSRSMLLRSMVHWLNTW